MEKQAPSAGRLAVMGIFAMSCFGLLLYLWTSFGGAVPLSPEGYRFDARFDEATQLADNADVRISGVTVGRVVGSELDRDRTRVTIEMDSPYAPVARDTRATLRSKTLLGETYIELTPGSAAAGDLPEDGLLSDTRVRPTVELDEVLRAFDPRTRRDLRRFLGGLAGALEGRGADVNAALGNAPPFARDAGELLRVLDSQEGALRRLVRDTGTVFDALGTRQGELSGLIEALDTVLATTAGRNEELQQTVRILPTTLRELRPALAELEALAAEAAPVVRDLRPGGRALAPALRDASALAPELGRLFSDLDRVTSTSATALPAATRTVDAARPLFLALDPLLAEALPVVDYAGLFRHEVVAAFANLTAATQASEGQGTGGQPLHYVRVVVPVTAEGPVAADERLPSNRHNPYLGPRALDDLPEGLEAFDCSNVDNPGPRQPAPECREQEPIEFRGRRLRFPHVTRDR